MKNGSRALVPALSAQLAQSGGMEGVLRVLTWNVLAHVHTHWNSDQHGGEPKSLESPEQRLARHRAVLGRLRAVQPDVALLQEVDEHFIPMDWQPDRPLPCGEMLPGYTPYRSYNANSGCGEGTVVLLRSDSVTRDTRFDTAYLAATKAHGWKTGVLVHVRRVGAGPDMPPLAVGSVHLRWGAPQEQAALLASMVAARAPVGGPTVIGGDFNAAPHVLAQERIDRSLLGAGLVRVPANEQPTGLQSGQTIDHLYVAGVRLESVTMGTLPPLPLGPWTEDGDHDGSDHAWVSIEISM